MPKTNKPRDIEQASSTPQKTKQIAMSGMVTPTKDSKSKAVSPAKTEPMSPGPIIVDVTDRNSRPRGILGMTRPKSALVMGTGMCLLGAIGYFVFLWWEVPGLNSQVRRLEEQVDRLSSEVNRLSSENDRYEDLNDEMNSTIDYLKVANVDLNKTSARLEVVNADLAETNEVIREKVDLLEDENNDYASLNGELNGSVMELSDEIEEFHESVSRLILENAALANLTDSLEGLTGSIELIGENQNSTVSALQLMLSSIVGENSKLEDLNNELIGIVSFLDETSVGLDNSLQQVTDFLATQIKVNNVLQLANIETQMSQRAVTWDCNYRIVFGERTYGQDFTAEIPASDVDEVVTYVFNSVLNELCLDRNDFSVYLQQAQFAPLTSDRLAAAVTSYTQAAIEWYFPEEGEAGLTYESWAAAAYKCENLQPSEEYRFNA